eukprot:3730331-Heterocapsa_arctica.AAC.1
MPCRPSEREDASNRHGHRARATLKETPRNETTKSLFRDEPQTLRVPMKTVRREIELVKPSG